MIVVVIWLWFGLLGGWMFWRGVNNEFGWGLRAIEKDSFLKPVFLIGIPLGLGTIIAALMVSGKYCFMSRNKALRLIDEKDLKEYGYYISQSIARRKGRL